MGINCDQDDDDIYFDEVYFCLTVCHEKPSIFALPPSAPINPDQHPAAKARFSGFFQGRFIVVHDFRMVSMVMMLQVMMMTASMMGAGR